MFHLEISSKWNKRNLFHPLFQTNKYHKLKIIKPKFFPILILLLFSCNTANDSIYGIDISHHQGKIDWAKVNNWEGHKINFVYIKATEGATFIDHMYESNIKGARENGFLIGSYHYFRTTSSPEKQFNNFITVVDKDLQDLIPLIDVEERKYWNSKTFHSNFQQFLDLVEDHFGKKPMIYTVNSFYNKNLAFKYRKYKFLIGRYGKNEPLMKDGKNWTMWQFSETGKVKGIPKKVDIDVLNYKYDVVDLVLLVDK
jgi:lysozyme